MSFIGKKFVLFRVDCFFSYKVNYLTRQKSDFTLALNGIIDKYAASSNFKIETIHTDGGGVFERLLQY